MMCRWRSRRRFPAGGGKPVKLPVGVRAEHAIGAPLLLALFLTHFSPPARALLLSLLNLKVTLSTYRSESTILRRFPSCSTRDRVYIFLACGMLHRSV